MYNMGTRTVREKTKKFGIILERKNKKKEIEIKICKQCGKEYKNSIHEGYCSPNCKHKSELLNNPESIFVSSAETELGKNIVLLRKQGFTYNEIKDKLGCSKSFFIIFVSLGST